ncbi:MAG: hypothetical protein AAFQ66_16970 [Pseudomonadota bacterium]
MSDYRLTKRRILAGAAAVAASSLVPATSKAQPTAWLDRDAAQAIATAARALGVPFFDRRNRAEILELAGSTGGRALIASDVRRDFAEGRTHIVEGWLLSRTEIELCIAESERLS